MTRFRFAVPALLALAVTLLPAALAAEDVYLKNGRVFRGVIAAQDGDVVRIEMPGGTLSVPASTVLRIESSTAVYREYQTRRDALVAASAKASDWLELARWAKAQGLDAAAREAALVAGRIDAGTPGVRAFLAEVGYVYDEASGGFLALEESMARKGMVNDDGAWVPRAEVAARRERESAAAAAPQYAAAEVPANPYAGGDEQEPTSGIAPIPYGVAGYGGGVWYPRGLRPRHDGPRREAPARPQLVQPVPQPQRVPQATSITARRNGARGG
jgi:hypothetical protein